MRRHLLHALALLLLTLPAACLQETAAVDPWGADAVPGVDTSGDAGDAQPDGVLPAGWRPVQIPIEVGESLVDWWGYTLDGVRTLAFVTDAGHFARIVAGGPVEFVDTSRLPGTTTALAYRAIWTADGKTFWFAGHGNVLRRGKPSLWAPADLVPDASGGDWNDLWGDGTSVIWAVGDDGAYVRLDVDGKNPTRLNTVGTDNWTTLTGAGTRAWMTSFSRVVALSNDEAKKNAPVTGQMSAAVIATGQFIERVCAIDVDTVFVTGKPTQLIRLEPIAKPAVGGPPIASGINAFFDVHGTTGGSILAVGESGSLLELVGGQLIDPDLTNLPTDVGLKRVWTFDDGSAYVLTAVGDVYYRNATR